MNCTDYDIMYSLFLNHLSQTVHPVVVTLYSVFNQYIYVLLSMEGPAAQCTSTCWSNCSCWLMIIAYFFITTLFIRPLRSAEMYQISNRGSAFISWPTRWSFVGTPKNVLLGSFILAKYTQTLSIIICYRIRWNFGDDLNLAIWKIRSITPNLNAANIINGNSFICCKEQPAKLK